MLVSLTDGEKTIWSETFGITDMSSGKAAVPSTLFGICSLSKMFAAMAVMQHLSRMKSSPRSA